jgi:D-alanyl-D-alanine carboxypeptidase
MKIAVIFLLFLSKLALAQNPAALQNEFTTMLKKHGISNVKDQAFCYDQDGLQGFQTQKLQRIASVTKIITTLLASDTLDLKKTFRTTLYIAGDRLHIAGGRDPYFEEEKILLLMQALNARGYKAFKTVTFDENFLFSDAALSSHQDLPPSHTRVRLAYFFSTKNKSAIRNTWLATAKFAKEEGVSLDTSLTPELNASNIIHTNTNPLKDLAPSILIHESLPLHRILKAMNVVSKNIVAQNVFLEAKRIRPMEKVLEKYGIGSTSYKIYNGSGLPLKTSQARYDNLATCKTVIDVIKALSLSLARQGLELVDVMAINGGKDLGSFRDRFLSQPETHEAVVSKTGTIMHASSLAGVIMIGNEVPFAILNHTTATAVARKFQDAFVARMLSFLGSPTPLIYEKISIFPWSEGDFLSDG